MHSCLKPNLQKNQFSGCQLEPSVEEALMHFDFEELCGMARDTLETSFDDAGRAQELLRRADGRASMVCLLAAVLAAARERIADLEQKLEDAESDCASLERRLNDCFTEDDLAEELRTIDKLETELRDLRRRLGEEVPL